MPAAPIDVDDVLGDVRGGTAHRDDLKDTAGHPMDCAKIIEDPAGGYWPCTTSATPSAWQPVPIC